MLKIKFQDGRGDTLWQGPCDPHIQVDVPDNEASSGFRLLWKATEDEMLTNLMTLRVREIRED